MEYPNDNAPDSPEHLGGESSPRPGPPSWKAIILGLCLAGMAAAGAAVLIASFLDSRPVDLRAITLERASDLERLLAYNQVPASSVVKRIEEERHNDFARWTYCEYEVELPPVLSVEGVARLVRRNMAERDVSVFDEPDPPKDNVVLQLATAGQHFATLSLSGSPDRSDLTEPSRRLMHEVVTVLSGMTPTVERYERGPAESRDNDDARWEFASVDAWVASSALAQSVATELSTSLIRDDVRLRVESLADAELMTTITIAYSGLDCVRVTIHAPKPSDEGTSDSDLVSMSSETPDASSNPPVPDPESLPLDSEHLNGDATVPAAPLKPRTFSGPLRAAIIIDDGGYGGDITEDILALDPDLTLSILPWAPHSKDTAERATELGFEVMLHMPMENSSDHNIYPGQLTTTMPPETIHQLTTDALSDVPGVVGINNHTGSRFTSDAGAVRAFLECIKPLELYFVDSRTISTSAAYGIAQEMEIPSAARDLFLDHESNKDYIRERFNQFIELTKEQGTAIGICHFRRNSAAVLREMLPEFEKNGIDLVHVSELLE